MKISDEIRQWCDICCDEYINADDCDELRELANRIDRETIELPMDADGDVIYVGDTLHDRVNDLDLQVEALRFDGQWEIRTELGYIMPKWFVPKHPDSFERIADELDGMVESADTLDDNCARLAELAERIRKLAEKEDK
jgi:hypothetical protein